MRSADGDGPAVGELFFSADQQQALAVEGRAPKFVVADRQRESLNPVTAEERMSFNMKIP